MKQLHTVPVEQQKIGDMLGFFLLHTVPVEQQTREYWRRSFLLFQYGREYLFEVIYPNIDLMCGLDERYDAIINGIASKEDIEWFLGQIYSKLLQEKEGDKETKLVYAVSVYNELRPYMHAYLNYILHGVKEEEGRTFKPFDIYNKAAVIKFPGEEMNVQIGAVENTLRKRYDKYTMHFANNFPEEGLTLNLDLLQRQKSPHCYGLWNNLSELESSVSGLMVSLLIAWTYSGPNFSELFFDARTSIFYNPDNLYNLLYDSLLYGSAVYGVPYFCHSGIKFIYEQGVAFTKHTKITGIVGGDKEEVYEKLEETKIEQFNFSVPEGVLELKEGLKLSWVERLEAGLNRWVREM